MFMLTRLHKNPQSMKFYIQNDCKCDFLKTHTERKKKNPRKKFPYAGQGYTLAVGW